MKNYIEHEIKIKYIEGLLKDLIIKKPSLMLVTPKMSTYGTISTYFSSNRVFDVTSYDVKDLECYTVYANELVVDALICVDKLK